MQENFFFLNKGPFPIKKILNLLKVKCVIRANTKIYDVKDLSSATQKNITFLNSSIYKEFSFKTKASFCITKKNLISFLPKTCTPIIVDNVLLSLALVTKEFYPNSINDDFDNNLKFAEKTIFKNKIKFGKNVLIGKNVKIGKNFSIGHNSIIESGVQIGNNCSIGSNVVIRKTIIENGVRVLDNCVIGKKGFGFFPSNNNNIRYPQIGYVILKNNCEIGCGSTIDRGSLSITCIGENTFLDNQVHVAHNVKIGNNCIIAGQVGFAGSTTIGNNVMIGGQAGISGHLRIGNNVQIGGGSGVVKNLPDNSKVMGYPATDMKNFVKQIKY